MEWIKFFRNQKSLFVKVLLTALVVSTTGVNVNAHFCKGELKSIALFKKAKTCSGKKDESTFEFSNERTCNVHKKTCCGYGSVSAKQILESKNDFATVYLNNKILNKSGFNQFFSQPYKLVNTYVNNGFIIKPPDKLIKNVSRTILYQIFRN